MVSVETVWAVRLVAKSKEIIRILRFFIDAFSFELLRFYYPLNPPEWGLGEF
jgi:hypothetical protein